MSHIPATTRRTDGRGIGHGIVSNHAHRAVSVTHFRALPEFHDASDRQLMHLAAASHYVPLEAGQSLYLAGDPARFVYLVVDGYYKVEYPLPTGVSWLFVHAGGQSLLGWRDVVSGGRRIAQVTAMEPSRFVAVPASHFRRYLAQTPAAVRRLVRLNAASLREQIDSARDLGTADLRRRLARYLTLQPTRQGYLSLPLSRSELASRVGSSRQSVSQVLADFRRRRVLEPDGREGWHVIDPGALARLSRGTREGAPAGIPPGVEGGRRPALDLLNADPVLGVLDPATLSALADTSRVVDVPAGRRLAVQGTQAGVVWLILSGQCRRELIGDHDTRLLLDSQSRLIGGYQAFIDDASFCTVAAVTPVRACAIPLGVFRELAAQDPQVGRLVLSHLAAEMRELVGATAALACLTPAVRLARHLLAIADEDGRIRLLGNQRDLADQLAVSRQTVNYLIGNLVDDGVLARVPGRNQFRLTDRERLAERAAAGSSPATRCGDDSSLSSASDAA